MSKSIKKIWNAVSTVLVALVVILALLLVGARVVGLQVYTVLSGSMEPTYHTGSLIYVKQIDTADITPGTVITFMLDEDTIATHRVVEVVPDEEDASVVRFRTKGDANESEDGGLVHYKNVIGTPVFTIPYLGYVASYIQNPPGMYIAIAAGAVLLLLVFLPDVFAPVDEEEEKQKKAKKQKKSAKRAKSAPDAEIPAESAPVENPATGRETRSLRKSARNAEPVRTAEPAPVKPEPAHTDDFSMDDDLAALFAAADSFINDTPTPPAGETPVPERTSRPAEPARAPRTADNDDLTINAPARTERRTARTDAARTTGRETRPLRNDARSETSRNTDAARPARKPARKKGLFTSPRPTDEEKQARLARFKANLSGDADDHEG